MLILTIRTDKPESEIGLFDDEHQLAYETWPAHRQLAETIHTKLAALLQQQGKEWKDIQGIVAYQGPGSFTGLRIGLSVANALASSYGASIATATGETWVKTGIATLLEGSGGTVALPEYGAPVHITAPKK
jgi:tRNA threonylcarbamoyladenosine biosynthesis protein TsaB